MNRKKGQKERGRLIISFKWLLRAPGKERKKKKCMGNFAEGTGKGRKPRRPMIRKMFRSSQRRLLRSRRGEKKKKEEWGGVRSSPKGKRDKKKQKRRERSEIHPKTVDRTYSPKLQSYSLQWLRKKRKKRENLVSSGTPWGKKEG